MQDPDCYLFRFNRTVYDNRHKSNRKLTAQALRYCISGGLAFSADFGIMVLLKEVFGMSPVTAGTVSFSIGLIITYVLSITWVFDERRLGSRIFEFLGFAAIGIIGLLLTWGLMKLLVDLMAINYMISKICVTVIITLWNFFAKKQLLFTQKSK